MSREEEKHKNKGSIYILLQPLECFQNILSTVRFFKTFFFIQNTQNTSRAL